MTWADWLVIVVCGLAAAVNVLTVGQPRKPTTPGGALAALIVNLGMALALVVAHR